MARYRIVEVNRKGLKACADITLIHDATFGDSASQPDLSDGRWFIVRHGEVAVAFAGVCNADRIENAGYFCRVGVLPKHRGRGLQMRLMRAIESKAREIGWRELVSDTANWNVHSANNFIRAGWELFWPEKPWAIAKAVYWRKALR